MPVYFNVVAVHVLTSKLKSMQESRRPQSCSRSLQRTHSRTVLRTRHWRPPRR